MADSRWHVEGYRGKVAAEYKAVVVHAATVAQASNHMRRQHCILVSDVCKSLQQIHNRIHPRAQA